jgi:hypothetical protein
MTAQRIIEENTTPSSLQKAIEEAIREAAEKAWDESKRSMIRAISGRDYEIDFYSVSVDKSIFLSNFK